MDAVARPLARSRAGGIFAPAHLSRPARRVCALSFMIRASHRQPGFLAALLHRLSGLALAIFLPVHFLALATALGGADAFDTFLTITRNPVVKTAELAL